MSKTRLQAFGVFAAIAFAFGAGLYAGVTNYRTYAVGTSLFGNAALPADVDLTSFWKTWYTLEEEYVPKNSSSTVPTKDERLWGAISGLVESYNDPYTVFLPPEEAQSFGEEISGSFEGVGMEVGVRDDVLTVVAPLKDTPAQRAGVRSGDRILLIDDTPAERMAVDEAIRMIRGPRGTAVTLTLAREGEKEPLRISITRSVIELPTISYNLHDDGVFVIELYNFSAVSVDRFRDALREFVSSGSDKLLLDLRGNPGGYLEAAVEMASYFLPVGSAVVTEDFNGKHENNVHRSKGYNVFANRPLKMAILVNRGSASASEILAGALAEQGIATLVGERTFGKGSVQQLIELGGGAELKVTVARWLTPKGNSISDGGLTPDIDVPMTQEDAEAGRDPQRDAAVQFLLR